MSQQNYQHPKESGTILDKNTSHSEEDRQGAGSSIDSEEKGEENGELAGDTSESIPGDKHRINQGKAGVKCGG